MFAFGALAPEPDHLVGEPVDQGGFRRVAEEHFQVELPDQDLDVECDWQIRIDVLAEDLIGLAQNDDVGGFVGGEDRLRARSCRRNPLAVLALAVLVLGDRGVFGQRFDQGDHFIAKSAPQGVGLDLGVLGDIVQEAGGDHLLRVIVLSQQLGDRQHMLGKGNLVAAGLAELTGMGAAGN